MIWVLATIGAIAAAYQLVALAACLRHLQKAKPYAAPYLDGVSILKPVHGLHPGFDEALRSHGTQAYAGSFELLLGYRDPDDSAVPEIRQAVALYPQANIRSIVCRSGAPNRKVGVLMDLVREARYSTIIINDADIVVPPGYIGDVTAPLSDPAIGVVTCLYRAEGDSWPARWEALGVATDFAPSALVAPFVGVSEFGFGSTLAFRRDDLDRIGGMAAIGDYLADDYQLAAMIHRLGRRNLMSQVFVRTRLHADTWKSIWRHQVRWARTVRLSRGDGYAGLPVTFATLWALMAGLFGLWWIAIPLLSVRLAMALTAGWFVLRSTEVLKWFWLIPLRDLYGAAVWAAGLFGNTVEWGGRRLRLDREGRIVKVQPFP